MKKELTNELQLQDDRKIWKRPSGRNVAGKQFLTNLLYMVNLKDTMKMIVPYFWNHGKTIIDVTAGKRLIWGHFPYNHKSACGYEHWHIDFNDMEESVKADYHVPAQQIHTLGKHWDILVNDFPFTDLKNGVESFGVQDRRAVALGTIQKPQKFRRDFYFRNFRPLNELFPECVEAFNAAADNMIVKIGNSHKEGILLTNATEAEMAFDHRRNPKSDFYLVDIINYRGNYARRGGRFPFAQTVVSYYMIFKKNPKGR